MEEYLNVDNVPKLWRKLFCGLRVSCHNLEIERGRYARNPKPPEERICTLCKRESETEEHFLLHCPAFVHLRNEFILKIKQVEPRICEMSSNDMFCTIMKHKTDIGLRIILKYVYEIHTKRCEFLQKGVHTQNITVMVRQTSM